MLIKNIVKAIWKRVIWVISGCPKPTDLLEMVFPQERFDNFIPVSIPHGYSLRQYRLDDRGAYFALLGSVGMAPSFQKRWIDYWEEHILPGGFYVIVHDETKVLVATCLAAHLPSLRHPRGGNLGWLAVHPVHKGLRLGHAVTSAVTSKLVASGYRRIYLQTHDFRLAAIKIYLQLGWIPLLYNSQMIARWNVICEKLGWPFTQVE